MPYFYLLFCIILTCAPAFSHDEGPSDEAITSELIAVVLQRFADMNFTELTNSVEVNVNNENPVMLRKKGRVFSLFLGSKHYEFSSKVTESDDVLRLFSLLWLNEARKACSTCALPDPKILEDEIENKLNMGWGSRAFVSTGDLLFEDFGGLAADIAYRKGIVLAILKVLGEAAEQVLTGGWHFVCEVVTTVAVFLTGPINFAGKSMTVPPFYENSRFLSSIRYMSAALVTKSILKRIDFSIKPFTINDHALEEFLQANDDRKIKHQVTDLTAGALRFIRLKGASQKVKNWSDRDQKQKNRVNRFLQGLESHLSRLQNKLDSNTRLSEEEKKQLKADIKIIVTIKRKAFLGKRFKRTFWLLKRKGTHSSAPMTQTNDLFKKSDFWYIPLEMEILNPHLNFTDSDRAAINGFDISSLSDETLWLSRRAEGERSTLALGKLIDSVRSAFDESLPKRQRQLHARRAGSLVNTVMPENMKTLMSLKLKELEFKKEGFFETFNAWFTKFGTRRRFSTFFKILDDYAYYLNFAAVSKGLKDPTLNLHMADHLNDIMISYSKITKAFNNVEDKEGLQKFTINFDREIRYLRSIEPWRDKRVRPTGIYNTFVGPVFSPFLNKEENKCINLYQYQ